MRKNLLKADSIILQTRDLGLLRGLFECRTMTAAHATELYFGGSKEAAKKRLQKLKASGFVGERRRQVFEPALLLLTPRGTDVIRQHGILAEYPMHSGAALEKRGRVSDLTTRHELAVMDVRAVFHAASRNTDTLSVAEFTTWPRLHQFEASTGHGKSEAIVRPDGFIRIHAKQAGSGMSEHKFFLEVDRSTEFLAALAGRISRYFDHYRSGGFAVSQGHPRSAFRDHPFRVLIVFKTAERRNNMAEWLLSSDRPILTLAYLSTMDEVRRDPLGAIWVRPLDYRDATKGTVFDPDRRAGQPAYRRQAAREEFVEETVRRQRLFPEGK